jgi:hypothetical protein
MRIEKFVSSMLPSLEKNQIRDDLRMLKEEISGITLPAYKQAVPAFKKQSFTARFTKDLDSLAKSRVHNYKDNYIVTVERALKASLDNLTLVDEYIEKEFSADLMRDAMDYLKTNLLQYKSMMRFLAAYSRRLLLITYTLETNPTADDLSKGSSRDLQWLEKGRDAFLVSLNAALTNEREIKDKLEDIPNVIVSPETVEVTQRTVGLTKTDPFQAGLIPFVINPIYHVRMRIAEWQVRRYELAKEEMVAAELKLLMLKESRSGKKDAGLERKIEVYDDRVQKLRRKILEMESND